MVSATKRILILCKTYPSPSSKYAETSCVAGMTEDGRLVRLYPVPFRLVSDERQFRKWQWIVARVERSTNDQRPESHRLFVDTIECEGEPLESGKVGWPKRMELLYKLPVFNDFATVQASREASGATLALLRPKRILELEIKRAKNPDWTDDERAKLIRLQHQGGLFDEADEKAQMRVLEKIPFDFYYKYECEVGGVTSIQRHKLVDWEVGALYRRLRSQYGETGWEQRFRQKYEHELPRRDLILMLGTIHRFPDQWLAVSVICPPTPQLEGLNQGRLF